MVKRAIQFIAGVALTALIVAMPAMAARTDNLWDNITANVIRPNIDGGASLLIYGVNKYLNFGSTAGSGGYGIRDNSGTIECKNSGGSWSACQDGGTGTGSSFAYPFQGNGTTTNLSFYEGLTVKNITATSTSATSTFTNLSVTGYALFSSIARFLTNLFVSGDVEVTGTTTANHFIASGTATNTFPVLSSSTSTISNLNGVIYVDGVRFARNSTGIQQAINFSKVIGGGIVELPCGIYPITSRITMADTNNTWLRGQGKDCTILKASNSIFTGGQDHYKGLLFIDGHTSTTSNVTVSDLTIDANNQATTTAMTVGGGLSGTGLNNVILKNLVLKNATGTSVSGVLNIFSDYWLNLYSNPHGYINGLTIDNVEIYNSPGSCIYNLGGNISNFTLQNSYIHDCDQNGFAFSDYYDDLPTTDAGGYDGGSYRTWRITNNRFENNFRVYSVSSRAHVMMNTSGGITDIVIDKNYFGGVVTTSLVDYMGINLYNSIGTKITNNFFGEGLQAFSFGKSQSANYAKINPMQMTDVSGNTFYKSSNIMDNDSSLSFDMHNNTFYETWGAAFQTYSSHFPSRFTSNTIINPSQRYELYGSCAQAAICVNANEGFVAESNTIIDDRKLKNPSSAPTLGTTAGGALGARTYYVQYTWINANGEETLPSPEASIAVGANQLLTVTLPSTINTTWLKGDSPGSGVRGQRIYASTTSGGAQLQWVIRQHTQDFSWTEPTTGLVASTTVPVTNNTKGLMAYGIYEANGNGDGTLPNVYRNNNIMGATNTPIVLVQSGTSISIGNISNPNASGNDSIEYEILETIASSSYPIQQISATSSDSIIKWTNRGFSAFLKVLNRFGASVFTIDSNENVGIATSTPGAKLGVSGDIFATGTIRAFSTTASSSLPRITSTGISTDWLCLNGTCQNSWSSGGSAYPFPLTGNATSSLTQFNGGITAFASSTIGGGTGTTGLTINGSGTTTGNFYIGSVLGVASSAPSFPLSVTGNSFFSGTGYFGNTLKINLSGAGTAIQTQTGGSNRWAISYSGGTDIVTSGASNQDNIANQFTWQTSGSALTKAALVAGSLGIGTSSPFARLDVAGANNGTSPLFQLSSVASFATTTQLLVTNSGLVGIGTTSPYAKLSVVGQAVAEYFTGTSSTAVNTFPTLLATNASSTNLGVTGQITQTGAATSSWTGGLSLGTGGLYITNGGLRVASLNAASCDVKADTNGVLSCGTDATGSGSAYPFGLAGNATSTLTQFNAGLTAYASSTIGGGGTYTGLTINGDATTTGALHLGTSVTGLWTLGVDSVTNAYKFSTNSNLYPSPLIISTSGNVGIGSTTPDVALDVTGAMEIVTNTDVVPFSITASTTEYVTKIENTVGDAQLRVVSSADYGAAVVLLEATADEYINIKGYIDGALKWIIGRSGEADGVSVFVSDGATEAIQFHDDRSTEFDGPMRFGLAGNCTQNLTSDAPAALDVDQCGTLSVTSNNTTSSNRTFCLAAGSEGQMLRIFADVSGTNEIELNDGGAGSCAGGTGVEVFESTTVWPAATNQNNDNITLIYRTTASGAQANGWYEMGRVAN